MKRSNHPSEPDFPVELVSQSDRAVAIVGGAHLETLLEILLKKFLNPKTHELLFRGYGPITTFSAKIDIAFAIGAISETEHSDIQRIRKIRNEFAHNLDLLSFCASPVSDHIALLKWCSSSVTKNKKSAIEDFKTCIAILSGFLKGRIDHASQLPSVQDMSNQLLGGF